MRVQGSIAASTERNFSVNGTPVRLHAVNSFIHQLLEHCSIKDRRVGTAVTPDNQLIAQVRGALPARCPGPD